MLLDLWQGQQAFREEKCHACSSIKWTGESDEPSFMVYFFGSLCQHIGTYAVRMESVCAAVAWGCFNLIKESQMRVKLGV